MEKSEFKAMKIAIWLCMVFCALSLCYTFYNGAIRNYSWLEDAGRSLKYVFYARYVIRGLSLAFIFVFVIRALLGLKSRKGFCHGNHRWLFAAAACLFVNSWVGELFRSVVRGYDLGWWMITANAIFKPQHMQNVISCIVLIIFALLYKLGEKTAEEQRLTI